MSDPKRMSQTDEEDPDVVIADEELVGIGFRGRGRPKLAPDARRREKIIIAVTAAELKETMLAAVNSEDGPLKLQDYVRRVLFAANEKATKK